MAAVFQAPMPPVPFIPGLANTRYDFVMSRIRSLALVVLAIALAAGGASAWAQQGRGQGNGNGGPAVRGGGEDRGFPAPPMPARERTMSESVRWAQKTSGGEILGAERVQSEGRDFNRVKVLDDRGRVRYMDDVPQQRRSAPTPQQQPPAGQRRPSGQ